VIFVQFRSDWAYRYNWWRLATKRLMFLADCLAQLKAFPLDARKDMGVQPHKVKLGFEPSEWKPMTTVGAGVRDWRS
jgi:phage-related protein